ncbi:MAG: DUF4242 domain-containing protein [Pseudomonadota bacterium]
MQRYVIERDIPGAGSMSAADQRAGAQASWGALEQLGPRIQWQESYVAGDRIFCVYLADNETLIDEHSKLSGIPYTAIRKVDRVDDPLAAHG